MFPPCQPSRVLALTVISWHTQTPSTANTRVLLAVEPHARPLLNLVCTQLLASRNRSVSLMLAQVHATKHVVKQQEVSQRRILDNFESLAVGEWGYRLVQLDDGYDLMTSIAVSHGMTGTSFFFSFVLFR